MELSLQERPLSELLNLITVVSFSINLNEKIGLLALGRVPPVFKLVIERKCKVDSANRIFDRVRYQDKILPVACTTPF